MPNYNGQLNTNEIFSAIYNMIISQQVFADNIKGTKSSLVDASRVDGSLYGDTKLYYSTDVLKSAPWGNDAEAVNLLALHRPNAPSVQAVTLDIFRQISLTVDNYLSKRAFSTSNAFSQFNSVMLGWIRDTKRVYDATTYNAFVGTEETNIGKQDVSVTITDDETATAEANNRNMAMVVAKTMADILVDLEDVTRDYNDYGYLRSYTADDFRFVWNAAWVNQIRKVDLPTIFHKDIIDRFAEYTLPARYFGTVNGVDITTSDGSTIRSLVEQDVEDGNNVITHLFAGDIIPTGVTLVSSGAIVYPSYTEDSSIAFKIVHKDSIPYMSAFEVGTSFFNPKSLTENHYLTFGHNTLVHLKEFPLVTARFTVAEESVPEVPEVPEET